MKTFLKMLQLLLRNYGTLNLKYKTMKAKMQKGGGMRKASTMNPTSRNTAMKALGVKKKSNAYSPSRFGENAAPTTGSAKMQMGGSKKMQKGGSWIDRNIINPANRWMDKNFRDPVNKKVSQINKKVDKNFRDPVNKKVAKISKSVNKNFRDPVNKYLDKTVRKPKVAKKAVVKKAVIKKTVKVSPKKS
jgi:hypothetical protein